MDSLTNDATNLQLQQAAFRAFKFENEVMDYYLDGFVTEDRYVEAMEATETAVKQAIAAGVSRRDLPFA